MILRHSFQPVNNTRLAHLCGPADANLRRLEEALGVNVVHRHEDFRVNGPKKSVQQALQVLQAAYEWADKPVAPELWESLVSGQDVPDGSGVPSLQTRRHDLQPRSHNQAQYLANIAAHDLCFGLGPAGTGKTYLAVASAVDALERSAVQRLVLTRPAVEAGEKLGYLPGDLAQKIDPYLRPLYDALYDLMGYDRVQKAFERHQIEVAPLAFMRGRTLNHSFVILDEAQNTTPEQMKMFLTRLGFGSRAVVTGDMSQVDLPVGQMSGLVDAERVLSGTAGVAFSRLSSADVVRHALVAKIVDAYDGARRRTGQSTTA